MASPSEEMEGLQRAVSDAFAHVGHMATRYVLVAEVLMEDGERAVWGVAPDGQQSWDTLGLLEWALQREQAGAVVDFMAENE